VHESDKNAEKRLPWSPFYTESTIKKLLKIKFTQSVHAMTVVSVDCIKTHRPLGASERLTRSVAAY
jgi:hypothetical protein